MTNCPQQDGKSVIIIYSKEKELCCPLVLDMMRSGLTSARSWPPSLGCLVQWNGSKGGFDLRNRVAVVLVGVTARNSRPPEQRSKRASWPSRTRNTHTDTHSRGSSGFWHHDLQVRRDSPSTLWGSTVGCEGIPHCPCSPCRWCWLLVEKPTTLLVEFWKDVVIFAISCDTLRDVCRSVAAARSAPWASSVTSTRAAAPAATPTEERSATNVGLDSETFLR